MKLPASRSFRCATSRTTPACGDPSSYGGELSTTPVFGVRKLHYVWMIALLCLAGCKKELIEDIHQNKIVDGNVAPPYNGVSTLEIENYVNKLYIDLISREPDDAELDAAVNDLKAASLDEASRMQIINDLMGQYAYYKRFFEATSGRFLNGIDSMDMVETLNLLQFLINSAYQQGDTLLAYLYEYEYGRHEDLYLATANYASGAIDINTYFSYFMDNGYYDEINMGSENFVKACFENLFFRLPTVAELSQGVSMVDGASSQIFLQDGNSKLDFIDIVTHTTEFYEGLVIDNYRALLSRDPESYEMDSLTQVFASTGDLKEVQRHVLKGKEYAGF